MAVTRNLNEVSPVLEKPNFVVFWQFDLGSKSLVSNFHALVSVPRPASRTEAGSVTATRATLVVQSRKCALGMRTRTPRAQNSK